MRSPLAKLTIFLSFLVLLLHSSDLTGAVSVTAPDNTLERRALVTLDDAQTTKMLYSPSGWTHATGQDPVMMHGGTESYSHAATAYVEGFLEYPKVTRALSDGFAWNWLAG